MKATFFRVQNKTNKKDFTDFDNIDDARAHCDQWSLTEETHELQKWEPNKKSEHMDIQLSFVFHKEKPFGVVIKRKGDEAHFNFIAAMINPHSPGKVQTVNKT